MTLTQQELIDGAAVSEEVVPNQDIERRLAELKQEPGTRIMRMDVEPGQYRLHVIRVKGRE